MQSKSAGRVGGSGAMATGVITCGSLASALFCFFFCPLVKLLSRRGVGKRDRVFLFFPSFGIKARRWARLLELYSTVFKTPGPGGACVVRAAVPLCIGYLSNVSSVLARSAVGSFLSLQLSVTDSGAACSARRTRMLPSGLVWSGLSLVLMRFAAKAGAPKQRRHGSRYSYRRSRAQLFTYGMVRYGTVRGLASALETDGICTLAFFLSLLFFFSFHLFFVVIYRVDWTDRKSVV